MSNAPKLLVASLCLALAGCETLTPALTSAGAADAFKPISASPADTCETQRQVAEHNSRLDTIKTGKETVYRAHCDQPQRVASSGKPTS